MIESFDYFFGGHVEMTDMGFRGKRVDDRIETDAPCGWRNTTTSERGTAVSATYRC